MAALRALTLGLPFIGILSPSALAQIQAPDPDSSDFSVVVDVENGVRLRADHLPLHELDAAVALVPGVDRHEGSDSLSFSGLGGNRIGYYLDGVPVRAPIPWDAVSSVEVFTGHVPASYGYGLTGFVSVTTFDGPARWTTGGSVYTTAGPYGNRSASVHAGVPLLDGRLRTFAVGEFEGWTDHRPSARPLPQLRDGLLENLMAGPQIVSENGDVTFRPYTLAPTDFVEADARSGNELQRGSFFGRVEWHPVKILSLSMSGRYASTKRDDLPFQYSLFQDQPFSRTEERESGLHGAVDVRLWEKASLSLIGDASRVNSVTHHPAFSSNVEDVLFYGDLDHPANVVASRYVFFDPYEGKFGPNYGDGDLPHPIGVMSIFAMLGAAQSGFEKSERNQVYLALEAVKPLGAHEVTVGASIHQQTRRLFRMDDPYTLARYYDDGNVEAGDDNAVSSYGDLLPSELGSMAERYAYTYFGYDLYGLKSVSGDDLVGYTSVPRESYDMSPHRPRRYSAFFQDRVTFGPIRLDLGLRLDAFDNNSRVLLDPYSMFPITRAGDLTDRPDGIGSEFAVYYSNENEVVGFRDLKGRFYDSTGKMVSAQDVILSGGSPNVLYRGIHSDVFQENRIHTVVLPRLHAEVRLPFGTTLAVSYNKFARHPYERSYVPLSEYAWATYLARIMDNSALKPERSTRYSVGLKHDIASLRMSAHVFRRTYDDLVGQRMQTNTFPNNIAVFDNVHDARVNGLELSLALVRSTGFWGRASYLLQEAKGTTLGETRLNWRMETTGDAYIPPTASLDLDRRHQIKLVAGYSVEEGPRRAGIRPLAGVDLSLFADLKSGLPYSTYEFLWPLWTNMSVTPSSYNSERMPWSYLLNLKVTKSFDVRGTSLGAYVWIENVLNRDNVVGVYSATGLADDDGYLASSDGQDAVSAWGELGDTFAMYYRYRLVDPGNFGIPRMIRVGVDVRI